MHPRAEALPLDSTRPFRLDLTGGFRASRTHDQEYPSWTLRGSRARRTASICWTDQRLVPPLNRAGLLRRMPT